VTVDPHRLYDAMLARARAEVTMQTADADLSLSRHEWETVDLGIAAGIAAAMLELDAAGLVVRHRM
jgi:hypothetical protein